MKAPAHAPLWYGVLFLGLALVLLAGCGPKAYVPPPLPSQPSPAPPPAPVARPVFYIKASRLNLRACPGMDCPKVSLLEKGEEVEKVGEAEDWFQIRVKRDGRLGWVDSKYLSTTPVAAGPEAAPAAPPPAGVTPPPLPEKPAPPAVERPPKPAKPAEEAAPPAKKKPEEGKPAKSEEEAPPPAKKKPEETKPAKPAPPEEKPAPPPAEPESGKKIRIM